MGGSSGPLKREAAFDLVQNGTLICSHPCLNQHDELDAAAHIDHSLMNGRTPDVLTKAESKDSVS